MTHLEQEIIPVGFAPPACRLYTVVAQVPCRGVFGYPPGHTPRKGHATRDTHSPVNRQTPVKTLPPPATESKINSIINALCILPENVHKV